jgi:chitinase
MRQLLYYYHHKKSEELVMQTVKKSLLAITLALGLLDVYATTAQNDPSQQPIVMGYWENWGTYHGFPMPNNAQHQSNPVLSKQFTGINALAYSFLEVANDGTIIFSDAGSDLDPNSTQDKTFCASSPKSCGSGAWLGNFTAFANAPVAHHVVSIGGAGHDSTWVNAFSYPDQFVMNLKSLVKVYNIDWLDIDYEPRDGVPTTQINSFINLTNKIKQEMPDLKISYTIPANAEHVKSFGSANWDLLAKNLTYVNIMGYDMHGAFDGAKDHKNPLTALHSALIADSTDFSDESTIKALNAAGIPNSKIILGMPIYGRAVGGVQIAGIGQTFVQSYRGDLDEESCSVNLSNSNYCSGMIQYKTLVDKNYTAVPVTISGKLSGVYAYDARQNIFVSYDNAESAKAKAQYVLDNHLAGAMFWALRFDKPIDDPQSIIGAVDKVFGITPQEAKVKLELTNNDPNNPITISLVTEDKSAYYPFPSLAAKSSITYTEADSSIVKNLMNSNGVLVLLTPAQGNQLWCQGKLNLAAGGYHHIQVYYDSPIPNCTIN